MDTLEFLKTLYGDNAPGYLVVWTSEDKKSRWIPAKNLSKAAQGVKTLGSNSNIYFGVGLQDQEAAMATAKNIEQRKQSGKKVTAATVRGFKDTSVAVPGLWIDIDIQGPNHAQQNLPKNIDEGKDLIASFSLAPTLLVSTGGGLHAYWLFKELYVFDGIEDRFFAQALVQRFQYTLQQSAKKRGWEVDSTFDLARVLRLPGSYNCKGTPVPVEVIQYNEAARYNPDDFERYLLDLPDEPTQRKVATVDPVKVLAGIPQGSRDTELFKYASSLRARGMKKEEAEILVLQAAAACNPPFPQREALAKIESAWKYPEGSEKTQTIEAARERLARITPENVFEQETIGALALMKDQKPGEYAKVKAELKGKVNMNDLERTIKKAQADSRKLHVAEPGEPPAPLEMVLPEIPLKELQCPGAWTLTENGVWTQEAKRGAICASPVPVILTERLRNIETGQERMTLGYYRDRSWHYITTDRATIFSHTAIVALANKGLPVNSVTAKDLVRYLADLERENLNRFPTKRAVQHLGWCSGRTFFPGAENDLVLDLDDTSISVANHYHPQGDMEEWIEIVKPIREFPVARFIMAAGFASPLLELIGERVFVIHTWGPSRGGKTAAMKAALSVWGNPEGIMSSFNATKVGLERTAALYSDLPLGIDERQIVGTDQRKIEEIIYTLSMGKSKARGTKSGGLQAFSTWRSIIMMNGEHPITNVSSSAGVKTRALEIYGTVIPDEEYAASLHRKLNRVFGVAGPTFIQRVIQETTSNAELFSFQEDYDAIYQELKKQFPENAASHLSYVTSILIGDFYSSTWIFGLDEDSAYNEAVYLGATILKQLESTAEMDEATRAMNFFMSWFAVNAEHFGNNPPGGKHYGFVDEGYVWIYPNIFDEAMHEGGFNSNRILRDWGERNKIKTEIASGEFRSRVRKYDPRLGKQARFVAITYSDDGS